MEDGATTFSLIDGIYVETFDNPMSGESTTKTYKRLRDIPK